MTARARASERRGQWLSAGSPKACGCGSRSRPSQARTWRTCSPGARMCRSPRCAMPPRDGAAEIRRIIDEAEEMLPRLRTLTAAEFLALDLPPRELIVDPWMPTQGLAMIHSARGIGKTHLALGIAYAVATGSMLLGWTVPEPRRVIYLDGEMPAA